MTYRNIIKKVFFISSFLLSCIVLPAQVMWNLKGGFMPVTVQHLDEDSEHKLNWMVGLEMEIPLSPKFNIETGLRYKNETMCRGDFYDNPDHTISHLELPIRLTYKYRLKENLSLRAGIGPYLGVGLQGDGVAPKVGVEPSVAVDWKCLSLGLTYNHPYYIDQRGKYKANSGLMLTLGVRFHSRSWKYVGAGLLAAGAVAGTVYAATQGDNSNNSYSQNSSSYSNSSEYANSNASNNKQKSKSQVDSSTAKNPNEEINYQRDRGAYEDYDNKLAHMQTRTSPYQDGFKDNERIQIQETMKSIRKKWQNKGHRFTKSSREDWDGK